MGKFRNTQQRATLISFHQWFNKVCNSTYNTCGANKHCPVKPQTSQRFGRCYKKYHTRKVHIEKQLWDTNPDSTRKITICSQAGEKIILVGSTSKCPDSRKTEKLCKKVGTSKKGSEYIRNFEGISNSLSFLIQQQLPREIRLNLKQKSVVVEEIGNLLKKVAIEKVHIKKVSAKSQFASNLKTKGRGQQACHQFVESKSVHPHHHIKIESLQSLRDILNRATSCANWI